MVLMDHNTKETRQGDIKHGSQDKTHHPAFHGKCSLHCFFTLGLLVSLTSNLANLGSIWADVTPDLLVGEWYKVWLCGGPTMALL
jgi:hypothetical protein